MFDLEKEIRSWSEAALGGRCTDGAGAAELADHLHCEIERERAGGASDEEAFARATRRLGSRQELAEEFARNRTLIGRGCAIAARIDGSAPADRKYLVANGFLWAAMMIAAAVLARSVASASAAFQWTFLLVLLPGWLGSEQILRRALRVARRGA